MAKSPSFDEWSDRVVSWLKIKNPAAPAVTREAEEEWNYPSCATVGVWRFEP